MFLSTTGFRILLPGAFFCAQFLNRGCWPGWVKGLGEMVFLPRLPPAGGRACVAYRRRAAEALRPVRVTAEPAGATVRGSGGKTTLDRICGISH